MLYYDTNGIRLEDTDIDLSKGYIEPVEQNVTLVWVIDEKERVHEEVVATYPNGGVDIDIVIDSPEQGHWQAEDENGKIVEVENTPPEDQKSISPLSDVCSYGIYHIYTQSELDKIEADRTEAEKKAKQQAEMPQKLEDTRQATAELGVNVVASTATVSDLIQAVAELGVMVAAK